MTDPASHTLLPAQPFSDRDLLRRFIHDADGRAFAQIVERHAALVMSVCRRVVGRSVDVDDAFQATFFALSQRPHSIYECRSLSGWLYSVAFRTSVRLVRLRKRTMMQPLPEQTPATQPDPLDVIAEASDLAALDEELNQLPEKYRNVLVMSYFAQQTSQEIADQLNESKGAVDGRIRDARRMLRVRLARRGVEVGVLTVAAAATQSASAAVPAALIETTIRLGSLSGVMPGMQTVPGVDFDRIRILTSTGTSVMTTKTAMAMAAGILVLAGVFGMARLSATQQGSGAGDPSASSTVLEAASGLEATSRDGSDQVPAVAGATAVPAITASAGLTSGFSGSSSGAASKGTPGFENVTGSAGVSGSPGSASAMPARPRTGAMAEFSRGSARAAERKLNELMTVERIPLLDFGPNASLEDVLHVLEEHLSMVNGDTLRILLDESDPDIGSDPEFLMNTQISGVKFQAGSMSVASALDLIFAKVKDQELTWLAKDEVLLITTVDHAESEDHLILRSYDIAGLRSLEFPHTLSPYQAFFGGLGGGGAGGMGGGGGMFAVRDDTQTPGNQPPGSAQPIPGGTPMDIPGLDPEMPIEASWEESLVAVITDMTSPPCRWIQNGDDIGTMSVAGNRLLVRQSRMGHESVVEVLDELELAAEEMSDGHASASKP